MTSRRLKYQQVKPLERQEAVDALSSDDSDLVRDALVRVAYHDRDWRRVQDQCLRLSHHQSRAVRAVSVTCLGHLARIHGALDEDKVLPVLRALLEDPETRGYAQDALDDIDIFLHRKR